MILSVKEGNSRWGMTFCMGCWAKGIISRSTRVFHYMGARICEDSIGFPVGKERSSRSRGETLVVVWAWRESTLTQQRRLGLYAAGFNIVYERAVARFI